MCAAKATFFLPEKDNQGRELSEEIDALTSRLFAHFFGWTLEGVVEGSFMMADGSQARDRSMKYSVVLDEPRLGELEVILLEFKARAGQEKIYLEVQHNLDLRFL